MIRRVTLAAPCAAGAQVLVLTEPMAQGALDLAVHALQSHPAVAGAVATLRVEMLEA